ncbi:uncharacterized protein LOC105189103 isoform X3 [Harpegnathos saltator]|uniref:uncharacterized protein LOC105189103 isoform X3 n=1 Tax=Harpegnathos saltator TaxID=610380 RepID=UPI000DBEE325|nr:uncharacterized protein LOC105189103 isoform X3 [Harpegnathos saltator]
MLVQCINAQIWRKRNIFKTLQCSMIFSAARPVGYIETKTIVWVGNRSCEMKRRAILLIDLLTIRKCGDPVDIGSLHAIGTQESSERIGGRGARVFRGVYEEPDIHESIWQTEE